MNEDQTFWFIWLFCLFSLFGSKNERNQINQTNILNPRLPRLPSPEQLARSCPSNSSWRGEGDAGRWAAQGSKKPEAYPLEYVEDFWIRARRRCLQIVSRS